MHNESYNKLFEAQKQYVSKYRSSNSIERIEIINKVFDYLTNEENRSELFLALKKDLHKPHVESLTSEIGLVLGTIKNIRSKLKKWMSDKKVSTPISLWGAKSSIRYEAKGLALIISPWNYPFQLSIDPMLYALAAGCCVVIKPSEHSEHTSSFINQMIRSIYPPELVSVVLGGIPESQKLLSLPFNHIYFTGSTTVGKIIMEYAAQHLASVTLELGGKSPCIIDSTSNISAIAKKLTWAKFYNTGQTCIAPDYVLAPKSLAAKLITCINKSIDTLYDIENNKKISCSPDYGRIISFKHLDRLVELIKDATNQGALLQRGGEFNRNKKFLEPTIIVNPDLNSRLMNEEIFGPILPIIEYDNINEVLDIINHKPKALSMYIMSNDSHFIKKVVRSTSSGGVVINDFLLHFANHNLPFGGINDSGIGKSHGHHGFIAFSNERSVMKVKWTPTYLFHPPYTNFTKKLASWLGKWI